MVITFCRLDVSLRFSVFHCKGSFPPSVFKNGTSYYNCQKYGEKNNKHSLICNKTSYIWKKAEMTCWKVDVLVYYNKFLM